MRIFVILSILALLQCLVPAQAQVSRIRQDFIGYGFPGHEHCSMRILPGAKAMFLDLETALAKAKHYVHIEYYKWYNDSIGRHLLDVLAECASRGVQVRLMYDAFGNSGKAPAFTREFAEQYKARGIRMVGFDPMRFPYVNHALHRLHRKMVIIDGRMVYTGGMNVADYYIHGKPELGKWGDMNAVLTGPIVEEYQRLFADLWYRECGEKLDERAYRSPDARLYKEQQRGYEAFVVDREPGKKSARIRQSYISCLDNAQNRVRIINPYVILVSSVRKAIRRCIERGVEVEILLGHKGDNLISEVGTAREVYNLARRGAKVWLCKECFHHDKVMIVDDSLCTVGTANLDARSLSFDYEVNAYFFSPEYCTQLNEYFNRHLNSAVMLTEDNWKELYPRSKRRLGWWTKGIRGIL
ncbi:MAG: phosphatidylserine/phosphatidylglycerophosphate/cardiolipin synthase family protein [Bacteroidaceae bacterium]|nr:phosphatidylserine/phosphatidylglycerophosphate/cardiolipin synthase family protein [Bacteroidaceae bacterium]